MPQAGSETARGYPLQTLELAAQWAERSLQIARVSSTCNVYTELRNASYTCRTGRHHACPGVLRATTFMSAWKEAISRISPSMIRIVTSAPLAPIPATLPDQPRRTMLCPVATCSPSGDVASNCASTRTWDVYSSPRVANHRQCLEHVVLGRDPCRRHRKVWHAHAARTVQPLRGHGVTDPFRKRIYIHSISPASVISRFRCMQTAHCRRSPFQNFGVVQTWKCLTAIWRSTP
jgi:hypothetical protein